MNKELLHFNGPGEDLIFLSSFALESTSQIINFRQLISFKEWLPDYLLQQTTLISRAFHTEMSLAEVWVIYSPRIAEPFNVSSSQKTITVSKTLPFILFFHSVRGGGLYCPILTYKDITCTHRENKSEWRWAGEMGGAVGYCIKWAFIWPHLHALALQLPNSPMQKLGT